MAEAAYSPPKEESCQRLKMLSGHTIPGVGLGTWRSASHASHSVYTAIVEVHTTFHPFFYCCGTPICLSFGCSLSFGMPKDNSASYKTN